MKKAIAVILALLLAVTMLPCAFAEGTTGTVTGGQTGFDAIKDVPADYWGRDSLSTLFGDGIMTGYQGYMRPGASITRGEFCAVVNRTFGFTKTEKAKLFSDINYANNTWKTNAVAIASSQGYLQGAGGKALADQMITREQAFTILSRILKQDTHQGNTTFSDDGQISAWAREQVNAMWKAGYVEGYQNKVNPKGNISRAETAQVVNNAMGTRISTAGTYDYTGVDLKNVTVTCDGTYIKNATIKGNLYITEGVGTGTVTIENSSIIGTTVISGGGIHSVVWINTSAGSVKIEVPDGTPVRLVLQGSSQAGSLTVNSNATVDESDVTGVGVQTLIIGAPEGSTITLDGDFESVEVNTPVGITLASGTVINNMTINSTVVVQGSGTVNQADVNANGVKFDVMPKSVTVDNNVSVPPTQTGGSTGGSTSTYAVSGIGLYGSFADVNAIKTNGKWVFDLTDSVTYKDTDTISKLKIITDGNSNFIIDNVGSVPTNQEVTITDAMDVLGISGPSTVSLSALRQLGSELSITGKINGNSVTIVFKVKSAADAYYSYSVNGTTITATLLKDSKVATFETLFGMDPVATALLRYTRVDTSGTYKVTATKGAVSVTRNYSSYNDMTNGLTSDGIVNSLNASSLLIDDLSDLTGYSVAVERNGTVLATVVFAG